MKVCSKTQKPDFTTTREDIISISNLRCFVTFVILKVARKCYGITDRTLPNREQRNYVKKLTNKVMETLNKPKKGINYDDDEGKVARLVVRDLQALFSFCDLQKHLFKGTIEPLLIPILRNHINEYLRRARRNRFREFIEHVEMYRIFA